MKQIKIKNSVYKNSRLELEFGKNYLVESIHILGILSDIQLSYAQNQVTSDLIAVNHEIKVKNGEAVLMFEQPISASHLYIDTVTPDISVEVFEVENMIDCYPKCIDKDLAENFYVESISITTKGRGVCDYSVYTSMNGRDFSLLERRQGCKVGTADIISANGCEARVLRVYLEYCSTFHDCVVEDIRFVGNRSNTPIQELPPIDISDFEASGYHTIVTEKDTFEEVYGIIERRIGKEYTSWFEFELCENPIPGHEFDYFELSDHEGKIRIKGNNGVSLATGLNHYLKYYCKVHISQVGDQVNMPDLPAAIGNTMFKETKAKVRYAYNQCTFSYTMAFWGKDEWRKELDWLALNGVNVVLDLTAQEEVWRRFLTRIGYSHEAVKNFIAGPAYYAWAFLGNLSGIGGPVHDSWFYDRTELARRNHLIMRKLGMYPVLQSYCGVVPNNINEYDKDVDGLEQGLWCSAVRPLVMRTTTEKYKEYAEIFYECQRQVLGNYTKYFAPDPFHEGGNPGDMELCDIAEHVLAALLKENPDAVWLITSWQPNPSSELLKGVAAVPNGREHALVLDLYAEKSPNYVKGKPGNPRHGYSEEFDGTPWIYCMLNNFGGRMGLHGHLDNLIKDLPKVFNTTKKNVGIGLVPEASENNPLLYDFIFEAIWQDNAAEPLPEMDIDRWLYEYSIRRYGKESKHAIGAIHILKDTVYKADLNMLGQGAPECVINARPGFEIQSASTWGNAIVSYDMEELKKALELLSVDYQELKHSEGYIYDLTALIMQVLSNEAFRYHRQLKALFENKDIEGFRKVTDKLLEIADCMDRAASSNEYDMLGRWLGQAEKRAEHADDFARFLYGMNARAQITTWGQYTMSEIGGLHDYSNRQWSGLIRDFYKPRWERWIGERIKELCGQPYEKEVNWFEWEWKWVRETKQYSSKPQNAEVLELVKAIELLAELQ